MRWGESRRIKRRRTPGLIFWRPFTASLEGGAFGGAAGTFVRATTAYYQSDTVGSLVSASSGAARFGYLASLNKPGLLIEPAATNRCIRSSEFTNAAWSVVGTATIVADVVAAPDGTTTADSFNGVAATDYLAAVNNVVVSGQSYVFSVYLKAATGTPAFKVGMFDNADANPSIQEIKTLTTDWVRYSIATFTADGTGASPDLGGFVGGYTAGATVYMWNAQTELGSGNHPTSPIPAASVAVTRDADSLSYTLPAGISANAGACSCWVQLPWTADAVDRAALCLSENTNARLLLRGNHGTVSKPSLLYGTGAATSTVTSSVALTGPGTFDHLLVTWSAVSGVKLYLNGVVVGTGATASAISFSGSSLFVGSRTASEYLGGLIRNVKVWGRMITPAEIAADYAAGA